MRSRSNRVSLKTTVYKNHSRITYDISDEKRDFYREISNESRIAKQNAMNGLLESIHDMNIPNFNPLHLMPRIESNNLTALSLFSGGGGLDLGFERAGYNHIASYELIPICKSTFEKNHPDWKVFCGPTVGDVTKVDWTEYAGKVNILHGGPPCQPFSIAGQQKGKNDERNMWSEFNRAVNTIKPDVFVAENVLGLISPKFQHFVNEYILDQLSDYHISIFEMHTADYGVPQIRRRVFFVGFRDKVLSKKFVIPQPTHNWDRFKGNSEKTFDLFNYNQPNTMGVREALGLKNINKDNLSPTIRSAFTGKRNTTSILNSTAGQKSWGDIEIWPNGIQANREKASAFPAKNGHFRLSVQDVGLLQGFPESWEFGGAVYQVLGQIGNSVAPPIAYNVAKNVLEAMS